MRMRDPRTLENTDLGDAVPEQDSPAVAHFANLAYGLAVDYRTFRMAH